MGKITGNSAMSKRKVRVGDHIRLDKDGVWLIRRWRKPRLMPDIETVICSGCNTKLRMEDGGAHLCERLPNPTYSSPTKPSETP